MSTMIPLTGTSILEFTPTELDQHKPKPVFHIRVPTFAMRDKISAILFQRHFIPPTMSQARGILIDALYELAGPDGEAQADDDASFLESYWTRAEVHEQLVEGWQLRMAERLFDQAQGVPLEKLGPAEPVPPAPYTMREQARQARLVTDVLERHDKYRTYQARFMVQQEEENEITVRLFLLGWENCGPVKARRDSLDRLEPDCIEELRVWLRDEGAHRAWDATVAKVKEQFGAPRGLEKNSDSPPGSNSSQTGSADLSGDLETNAGGSTTSTTTPIPRTDSPETSAESPNSRSGKRPTRGKASAPRSNGRTAKA